MDAQHTLVREQLAPEHWLGVSRPTSALALITTVDGNGSINAAPNASVVRVSQKPLHYSFTCSEDSDTLANVLATGQFGLNFVPFDEELLQKVLVTAEPFPRGVDEAAEAGLTALPGVRIAAPRLAECYSHFELETLWHKSWSGRSMIVGRVLAVSVRPDCLDDKHELVWDHAQPVHYWAGGDGGSFSPIGPPTTVRPQR